ncbi:LysR family transcriptional regulator [Cohnella cellulosilytica]|uniref:LysR family transcriptional regulator n=1 Tax=Cohnella cellulosilytica TaxID=986710 RepID=A0ABW2FCL3_9BACL
MEMNTEWYRVFYRTALCGSLSKAAEALHITQPAVSHTIKQLERQLGTPLFFRTPKGVVPTHEGKALFVYLDQEFRMMEAGEKKLAEMRDLESGEIHIGASDTLCKHYLLPYLREYRKAYPKVRIHVTNRTTDETLALLRNGHIDFGIVNLPVDDDKVDVRESLTLHECLIADAAFSPDGGKSLTLAELRRYPLILLESGGSIRRFLDRYASSHGAALNPELELGSIDLIVQFVRSGFGLAFAAREFVREELASGQIVEVPLLPSPPPRRIGIVTLKGTPLSAASQRFISLLPAGIG